MGDLFARCQLDLDLRASHFDAGCLWVRPCWSSSAYDEFGAATPRTSSRRRIGRGFFSGRTHMNKTQDRARRRLHRRPRRLRRPDRLGRRHHRCLLHRQQGRAASRGYDRVTSTIDSVSRLRPGRSPTCCRVSTRTRPSPTTPTAPATEDVWMVFNPNARTSLHRRRAAPMSRRASWAATRHFAVTDNAATTLFSLAGTCRTRPTPPAGAPTTTVTAAGRPAH